VCFFQVLDWVLPLYGAFAMVIGLIALSRGTRRRWLGWPLLVVGLVFLAYLPARLYEHPWQCLERHDAICYVQGSIVLTAVVVGPFHWALLMIVVENLLGPPDRGDRAESPLPPADFSSLPRYPVHRSPR
jgi:hypothetical protein